MNKRIRIIILFLLITLLQCCAKSELISIKHQAEFNRNKSQINPNLQVNGKYLHFILLGHENIITQVIYPNYRICALFLKKVMADSQLQDLKYRCSNKNYSKQLEYSYRMKKSNFDFDIVLEFPSLLMCKESLKGTIQGIKDGLEIFISQKCRKSNSA